MPWKVMGVKGLQVFADNCPGTLVRVNIARLASNFHRDYGTRPVLLVDGMGCMRTFYSPQMPWVYGGQWKQFVQKLERFVSAFTKAGIELVFIYDGVVEMSKMTEWVRRRNAEIRTVAKIFQSIKEDGRHPRPALYHLPASGINFYATQFLKHCGVTVYNSIIEADRAIFHYYKKHRSFGVLGQDSDFLVFDIHNYFSLNSLHIGRQLKIKRYDKTNLCRQLRLQPSLLPLLACLMGNDVIAHHKLNDFHCRVTGSSSHQVGSLLPAVANFLSGLQISRLTPDVVADLEQHVFGKAQHMWGLMDKVVRQYIMVTEPETQHQAEVGCSRGSQHKDPQTSISEDRGAIPQPAFKTEVFQAIKRAHENADISPHIFNIFADHLYQRGPRTVDFTDSTMPTIDLLFRPIRKRVYGLLLGVGIQEEASFPQPQRDPAAPASSPSPDLAYERLSSSNTVVGVNAVREWVAEPGQTLAKQPDIVEAKPLNMPGGTPRLETFWLGPQAGAWPLKLQAFLACMHCDIDPALLHCIPVRFILLCIILRYFYNYGEPKFLQESDVDAFLAQAVCLQMHTVRSLNNLMVGSTVALVSF